MTTQPPADASAPDPTGPAQGIVRLTLQGNMFTTSMVTPTVRINGYPMPASYGTQDIPVWAGPTRVDIETQWTRTYGQAGLAFDVAPGQVVDVFYAAPYHVFAKGAIGHTKQRRAGLAPLLIGLAVFIVFVALVIGLGS
jgi:hypothetical protein